MTEHDLVELPGGEFAMGRNDFYPEEAPVHRVRVDGFAITRGPVTNAQFGRFVAETGYVTLAERVPDPAWYPEMAPEDLIPGSLVFQQTDGPVDLGDPSCWWRFVPGACWQRPNGPGSGLGGLGDHPVVHIAYPDAAAYAAWAGLSLPTEAQWELAAIGGLHGRRYPWGDEFTPGGQVMANTWHGRFPWENLAPHGFRGTSPVGSFAPNGFGLHDMCGNVWEWTRDFYAPHGGSAKACCVTMRESADPSTGTALPRRVLKGGSWLCSPTYCHRYRPAARQPQTIDSSTNHLGFRCVAAIQTTTWAK